MNISYKYLTSATLHQLATFNLDSLPQDTVYPVQTYDETGENVRATVVLNEQGTTIDITMDKAVWNTLPTKESHFVCCPQ